MNGVLNGMGSRNILRLVLVIKKAFAATKIHPLCLPRADTDQVSRACTASLQCAGGKKAAELDQNARQVLVPIELKISATVEPTVIIAAK